MSGEDRSARNDRPSSPTPETWADVVSGLVMAAPITLVLVGQFSCAPISGLVIGRWFGTAAFTGFSLANLSGNLIGLSMVSGMQSGMDTLLPVAYGAEKWSEVGDTTVRGALLTLFGFLLLLPVWLYGELIFRALGMAPESAQYGGEYLQVFVFATLLLFAYETVRRFLACQHILWPVVWCTYFGLFVQVSLLGVFLRGFGFGFISVAWAHVCGNAVALVSLLTYVCVAQPHHPETWPGLRASAFRWGPVWEYLKLAVPGFLAFSEWWYWEITTFMSGWIGDTDEERNMNQAAQSCAYLAIPLWFLAVLGLGISCNIKIGHAVGAGDIDRARSVACNGQKLIVVLAAILATAQYLLRDPIIETAVGYDEGATALAKSIWPNTAVFVFFDVLFCMQQSITRALGLQLYQAASVFGVLFCLGLPAIYVVTFTHGYGLRGMWIVLPIADGVMTLSVALVHVCKDWSKLSLLQKGSGGDGDGDGDVDNANNGTFSELKGDDQQNSEDEDTEMQPPAAQTVLNDHTALETTTTTMTI